ncbi:hypothetical protein RYX36_019407 [Vicia faba]
MREDNNRSGVTEKETSLIHHQPLPKPPSSLLLQHNLLSLSMLIFLFCSVRRIIRYPDPVIRENDTIKLDFKENMLCSV